MKRIGRQPPPPHATLLTADGASIALPMEKAPSSSFTYAGRLWAYNQILSDRDRKPIFEQITPRIIASMRDQAEQVKRMADRFEAMMKSLETPEPPADSITT